MAKIFDKENASLMSFGKAMSRMAAQPLDESEVWYDRAELEEYAASGETAYAGMKVAYVDINKQKVYQYSIQLDGTLKEIGTAPVSDGATVAVDEETGKLSLYGIDGLDKAKTYVPSIVNGQLTWAEPDTSTAEGQAQEINALKTRAAELEATVNGVEAADGVEAKEGLVDKVAAIEADYLTSADKYDDSDLQSRVEALEGIDHSVYATTEALDEVSAVADAAQTADEVASAIDAKITALDLGNTYEAKGAASTALADAKSYVDTELAGITLAIEDNNIVIRDNDNNIIADVDATYFTKDSFLDDVAYDADTHIITFTWKMADETTKTDSINVTDLIDTYTAGTGLTLDGGQFAVNTSVIATVEALNGVEAKADKGIDDAAAAQTAIDNYAEAHKDDYDNTAIDTAISDAIDGIGIGDYAKVADVYSKTDADEKFQTIIPENTYDAYGAASAAIDSAKSYTDGQITAAKGEIKSAYEAADAVVQSAVDALEEDVADHETRLAAAEKDIDDLQAVGAEKNVINSANSGEFTVTDRELGIKAVAQDKITGITNAAGNATTIVEALATKVDAKTTQVEKDGELVDVAWTLLSPENQDKLAALVIDEDGSVGISGTINAENVDGLSALLAGKVDKVEGMGLSANNFTNELLAKLNGIAEGAQVNVIETIKVAGTALTVTDKGVDIGFAALNTAGVVKSSEAENGVKVAEDGTMSVNSVNVNKLVQTESEELVLNGGSSNV